jgi:hypothetical protein
VRRGIPTLAPVLAVAAAAALAIFGGLAGCSKVRGVLAPNRLPETTIWVTGNLDTVGHAIRVFWNGEDPDGQVVGFEFKWIYEPGAAPAGYDSSLWTFTDRRDSLFTVFSPDGVDYPTLVVRAIDDQGAADDSPARQRFGFTNLPPTIELTGTPPASTLPVAVFTWSAHDPDGILSRAHYRVWLDGREDRDTVLTDTVITIPPYFFQELDGQTLARRRTAFVACIDDGGRMSEPDSFAWNVAIPVGNTLLVDDVPGNTVFDTFYRTQLDTRLGAGAYTTINLEQQAATLRTSDAVLETFELFDNVFWYSENNGSLSSVLRLADQPIRDYLASGRNLFITSTRLVGTGGALGSTFAREVLGVDAFRVNLLNGSTNFVIDSQQYLVGAPPFGSLQAIQSSGGTEAMVLEDPADAAYLAPPGALQDTLPPDNWPVAVNRRYGGGSNPGRIVYLGFPLRILDGVDTPGMAAIELEKVFILFGI